MRINYPKTNRLIGKAALGQCLFMAILFLNVSCSHGRRSEEVSGEARKAAVKMLASVEDVVRRTPDVDLASIGAAELVQFKVDWLRSRRVTALALTQTEEERNEVWTRYLNDLQLVRKSTKTTQDYPPLSVLSQLLEYEIAEGRDVVARDFPREGARLLDEGVPGLPLQCRLVAEGLLALREVRALSPELADMVFMWHRKCLETGSRLSPPERAQLERDYRDFLTMMRRSADRTTDEGVGRIILRVEYSEAMLEIDKMAALGHNARATSALIGAARKILEEYLEQNCHE